MIESSCTHKSARDDAEVCPTCGARLYRCGGVDYTEFITERTRHFTGREWVFRAVDDWLAADGGSRVFFLSGGPGTGKSAAAARLVEMSAGAAPDGGCRRLGPGFLTFYQFCQAAYDDTLDPLRFVTSLFLHLKERYPAFLPALWQTMPPDPAARVELHVGTVRDHGTVVGVMHNIARLEKLEAGALSARVAFNRLIAAPLKRMDPAALGSRPLVILLDALDEALTHPGETLVDLLTAVLDDPRDLPPFVRFLVTGRPDDRVVHAAGDPALDLLADAPPDIDDVRAYAHRQLSRRDGTRGAALADRIVAAAGGNFLYARYVIDDLPPLDTVGDVAALPLPADLHDVYRQFLRRELAHSLDTWDDDYCPLLGALAVAQSPGFTARQLAQITGLRRSTLRKLLRTAGQYLAGAGPEGPFRIYHQSFHDFLLHDDDYCVFSADAHGEIADFFWQVFHNHQQETAPADGMSYVYSVQHLPHHLAGAGDWRRLRELLLDYEWLSARLAGGDVAGAIGDYELAHGYGQAEDLDELCLVGGAIRLSAHVVSADPAQLPSQLHGRLLDRREPGIQALLAAAAGSAPSPWLRTLTPTLAPPGGPRLRALAGHTDAVNCIAVLPDGRRAVSGSDDRALIVWDLKTGERLRTLIGHSESVNCVAVLPDGRRAVSGSDDRVLIVWDLETGEQLHRLEGHSWSITSVVVPPGGQRAVSTSGDRTLIVWDLETGKRLRTLEGHSSSVYSVAALPDGQQVVSGSEDRTLIVWNLETGEQLRRLVGCTSCIRSVAVLPDGQQAVSGSEDGTLIVWDLKAGKQLRTLERHDDWVRSVGTLADGRRAVSGSDDRKLIVWDLETGEQLRTLEGHGSRVRSVAVLPDGRQVVSGSEDGNLIVWDMEMRERPHTPDGHSDWVNSVAVLPDRGQAVSASGDRTLIVWDLKTGRQLCRLTGHRGWVSSVATLPDGRRAVSASDDRTLIVWDLGTGERLQTMQGHVGMVCCVAVLPDGRRAVSASSDRTLIVWDLETGEQLRQLAGHSWSVTSVAVLPDGRRAVSTSRGILIVWDLETGQWLRRLVGHSNDHNSVAVLPDGRQAVSASSDGSLILWNLETGRLVRTLEGHGRWVNSVAALPDGRRAVSASDDRTLIVWDLETGGRLATFTGDAAFHACAVTSDGGTVIAGDDAGCVHFLRIEGMG